MFLEKNKEERKIEYKKCIEILDANYKTRDVMVDKLRILLMDYYNICAMNKYYELIYLLEKTDLNPNDNIEFFNVNPLEVCLNNMSLECAAVLLDHGANKDNITLKPKVASFLHDGIIKFCKENEINYEMSEENGSQE